LLSHLSRRRSPSFVINVCMKKNSYRRLFVWAASVDLAVRMIELADSLVAQRRFALADQLLRAACSVPNNIAEGQGRYTTRDRRQYLVQARGSLYELETQLEILSRAKVSNALTDTREAIAKIECGLTKMIDGMSPDQSLRL
jgi:four helix bundle protein